jgi:hypothetical protein
MHPISRAALTVETLALILLIVPTVLRAWQGPAEWMARREQSMERWLAMVQQLDRMVWTVHREVVVVPG